MTREQFDARFKEALKHWTQSVGTAGLGDCVWASFYRWFNVPEEPPVPQLPMRLCECPGACQGYATLSKGLVCAMHVPESIARPPQSHASQEQK